jgi:hypothetical protein
VEVAQADDSYRSAPLHREAGTRTERFLAATSQRVILGVRITHAVSVRLEDVVLTIP